MVFMEPYYPYMLVIHLLAAFMLVGLMQHNLYIAVSYVFNPKAKSHEQFNIRLAFVIYVFVYIIGCLIYPYYRIHIRAEYFDKVLPLATSLFETKEHLSSFGLALMIGYVLLNRYFNAHSERYKLPLYIGVCFLINLILWYQIIMGPYLVILKGS